MFVNMVYYYFPFFFADVVASIIGQNYTRPASVSKPLQLHSMKAVLRDIFLTKLIVVVLFSSLVEDQLQTPTRTSHHLTLPHLLPVLSLVESQDVEPTCGWTE